MARSGIIQVFGDTLTHTGESVARYPLGTVRVEETDSTTGCETYRYVKQNEATVAAAANAIAYLGQTLGRPWEVGMDVSDVDSSFACGVYQSILTNSYYGWIKRQGYVASLLKKAGSGAVVKGDILRAAQAATDDGKATRWSTAKTTKVTLTEVREVLERPVGYAASTATTNATSVKAYVDFGV